MQLFEGVRYRREARSEPRPLMLHIVEVDLKTPGLTFLVTPGDPAPGRDLPPRTTTDFLNEFDVQLAVNGGFFESSRSRGWLGMGEEILNVWGLAISSGQVYSQDYPFLPVLCISESGATIQRRGCPLQTEHALAGTPLLVVDDQPASSAINRYRLALHPRTAVALDESGDTMWLILVDGRQPGYSEGVTLPELADIAISLGAASALNLDGGGSTTLVVAEGQQPRTLNAPIHRRFPMRQRPVGNHLGIRVPALSAN
jgi:hypothetical protein